MNTSVSLPGPAAPESRELQTIPSKHWKEMEVGVFPPAGLTGDTFQSKQCELTFHLNRVPSLIIRHHLWKMSLNIISSSLSPTDIKPSAKINDPTFDFPNDQNLRGTLGVLRCGGEPPRRPRDPLRSLMSGICVSAGCHL